MLDSVKPIGPLRSAETNRIATDLRQLSQRTTVALRRYAPCALLKQLVETGGNFYADS